MRIIFYIIFNRLISDVFVFFFFSIYLLIITLNKYIYDTTEKKHTLTVDINRVRQN